MLFITAALTRPYNIFYINLNNCSKTTTLIQKIYYIEIIYICVVWHLTIKFINIMSFSS